MRIPVVADALLPRKKNKVTVSVVSDGDYLFLDKKCALLIE